MGVLRSLCFPSLCRVTPRAASAARLCPCCCCCRGSGSVSGGGGGDTNDAGSPHASSGSASDDAGGAATDCALFPFRSAVCLLFRGLVASQVPLRFFLRLRSFVFFAWCLWFVSVSLSSPRCFICFPLSLSFCFDVVHLFCLFKILNGALMLIFQI